MLKRCFYTGNTRKSSKFVNTSKLDVEPDRVSSYLLVYTLQRFCCQVLFNFKIKLGSFNCELLVTFTTGSDLARRWQLGCSHLWRTVSPLKCFINSNNSSNSNFNYEQKYLSWLVTRLFHHHSIFFCTSAERFTENKIKLMVSLN